MENEFNFEIDLLNIEDKTDSEILSKKAIEKNKKESALKKGIAKRIINDNIHYKLIKHIQNIINLPKKNEQFSLVTQNAFNIYSLILFILSFKKIDSLIITTFNMNKKTFDGLINLLDDEKIKELKIVISESITFRMPKRIIEMENRFFKNGNNNFKLALTWNHSKIALIKCDSDYYVIEGSGNFSDNSEIEQYRFENNKQSYDFHFKWINERIFNKEYKKRDKLYKNK